MNYGKWAFGLSVIAVLIATWSFVGNRLTSNNAPQLVSPGTSLPTVRAGYYIDHNAWPK